jgi:lipopolysaccharide export LptBFGC system permease protein LptF
MEINDGFWKLNNCNMPIVTQASHIGIQKSENCSAMTTVTENIRKARRALYSLMGTLVMLPYIVIALICISASIGRVPARMQTAGSATLIYSDRICFIHFLYCHLI